MDILQRSGEQFVLQLSLTATRTGSLSPKSQISLRLGGGPRLAVPYRRQISAKSSITRPLGCLVVPSVARILINGYTSKIRVAPRATLSSNDRSPIRFGNNMLKTGGSPKKPRKSVDDSTITSDTGNDRLRSHPDKYCTWGEKDTRYSLHAQACYSPYNLGISLHLRVPIVI